jgi:hypothetical protein
LTKVSKQGFVGILKLSKELALKTGKEQQKK